MLVLKRLIIGYDGDKIYNKGESKCFDVSITHIGSKIRGKVRVLNFIFN